MVDSRSNPPLGCRDFRLLMYSGIRVAAWWIVAALRIHPTQTAPQINVHHRQIDCVMRLNFSRHNAHKLPLTVFI